MPNDAGRAGAAHRARVILGASCYCDAEAALALAMELARHLGAELHGVFVRETAVLAAAYAHSRVVSYSGQPETGLTAGAIAKAFRADAKRFEGLLSSRAKAAALVSSFRESEGRVQEELRNAAQTGDILVLGFKPILRAAGCIALILAEDQEVPEYAVRLAGKIGKPLVALIACADGVGPAAVAARREPAENRMETRLCVRPETILRHLEHMNPAAVIVAAPLAGLPSAARIQDAARCPVVIQSEG